MKAVRLTTAVLTTLLAAAPALFAQGNSEAARLRSLNTDLLRLHGLLQSAAASQQAQIRSQAGAVMAQRAAALSALIASSPAEALSLAFPSDLLAELAGAFPESASLLETRGQFEGPIEYLVEDRANGSRSIRRMQLGSSQVEVHFAGPEPPGLQSRDILSVQGVRSGGQIAAANGTVTQAAAAGATCSTTGAQNIVAILLNFPTYKLPAAANAEMVKGILWGNANTSSQSTPDWRLDDFWQQASDGKTWAPFAGGKVAGPYTLNSDFATCDTTAIKNAAIAAADADVNFLNYSRIILVMPNNNSCGIGYGSIGCWSNSSADGNFTASIQWDRADFMSDRSNGTRLTEHEGGHNLGLNHANTRDFGADAIGPLGAAGTVQEYNDYFSVMGYQSSAIWGPYSAQHQVQNLGWLTSPVNYVTVETSGTYTIENYETRPAGALPKVLKIRRGTGNDAWVWLEYRQKTGIYESQVPNNQVFTGALIHYLDSTTGSYTHLADFTTGTSSFLDPALAVGQTWTDPYSNLSITVNSANPSGTPGVNASLNVTVTYGALPCNEANPTVTITPDPASVQEGKPANFNVAVKNNDTAGCASSTYNLSSSLPSNAGWTSSLSPSALTIAPGATGNATLTKTPPAGSAGQYTVDATAAKTGFSGADTATLNVTAPPPPVTVTVDVPAATYPNRTRAPISATVLSGSNPAAGASVTFRLVRPGNKVTTQTMTTGADGKATWSYRVNGTGTYSVTATATYGGQTSPVSNTDTFTVN